MPTTLYLIRHAATEANLCKPYRLQGRNSDPVLAPVGIRQAELTRDVLASVAIDHIWSSPLRRAVQTAEIIAAPHAMPVQTIEALTECDVGRWEGLTWDAVREQDAEAYQRFVTDPGIHGYPGGEDFFQVAARAVPEFARLLHEYAEKTLLVVSHHVVNRVFLAGVLGLLPSKARKVRLDNCGISIVVKNQDRIYVEALNATFHLGGDVRAAA